MRILLTILVGCELALMSPAAQAQERPSEAPQGVVAIGPGTVPEYDGSGELRLIPFAVANVEWRGTQFQFQGLRARADLASDTRFSFGPVIGGRLSRDGADGQIALLPELDTAVEAGAFAGYRFGGDRSGQGALRTEITLMHDVSDVHDGLLATASASYAAINNPVFQLSFDMQTSWADENFLQTYFGVDGAASAMSGLSEFSASSGIKDVGIGMTAGYWLDDQIGLIVRAGTNYLVGDAADSPITEEGDRWQPMIGTAIAYRF